MWGIVILIEATMPPITTAIAGTGRAVTPLAVEWRIKYTFSSTFTSKRAFLVVITFKRHTTSVSQLTMQLNFLTNSRLVFTYSFSDSSFSGTISYAGEYNVPIFEC